MAALQDLLTKDKEKILNEITDEHDAEILKKKIDAELGRLLFLFNEEEESDRVKSVSYAIIQTLRSGISLVDSVKEASLYTRTALNRKKDKNHPAPLFWLLLGIGTGGAAGALILLLLSVRAVQMAINLPLFLILIAAALVCCFFAGKSFAGKQVHGDSSVEALISYDPEKIYRSLFGMMVTADMMLQDVRSRELIEQRHQLEKDRDSADMKEVSFLAQLLEDAYASRNTDFGMEAISHIKYYLHGKNIETLDYSRENQAWFDMLPGEGGTIRPALASGGMLLKKGLASGGRS